PAVARKSPPSPSIEFSHRLHLGSTQGGKMNCVTCHRGVPVSASRSTLSLPTMVDCAGCHESSRGLGAQFQMSNCGLCHRGEQAAALPVSHNSNIRPASHNQGFRVEHREQASQADAKCFACHTSVSPNATAGNQCISCHQATRPESHT